MLDYSMLAIASAFCLLAGYFIWTLVKVQKLIDQVQDIVTKVEPETFKFLNTSTNLVEEMRSTLLKSSTNLVEEMHSTLLKSSTSLVEEMRTTLTTLDPPIQAIVEVGDFVKQQISSYQDQKNKTSSSWAPKLAQGALFGLKIFRSFKK